MNYFQAFDYLNGFVAGVAFCIYCAGAVFVVTKLVRWAAKD
jgi:hypothetical protein